MSDSPDAQLLLKKRARRRLVGAVAFAGLAAVVLPMVMDEEPKPQMQDIQIRIPGQDAAPFNPSLRPSAVPPATDEPPAGKSETASQPVGQTPVKVAEPSPKPEEKPAAKPADKPAEKHPPEKPTAKPAEKPPEKPVATPSDSDTRRAAAILGVKPTGEPLPAASGNGQFEVRIGAFSNPANVKQLQTKLGELGIKVYTEPAGDKTRVRAGPFASREAAEKALEKMKRIGVNGVVAAK